MTVHRSPDLTVEPAAAATLIALGGYVHPLFTDPGFLEASPFAARPLPGQALLLLMGGLAEQCGAYDERTLALLGLDEVVFHRAAVDGDTFHVEVEQRPAGAADGRVTSWWWRAVRADGVLLGEATARFLMRR